MSNIKMDSFDGKALVVEKGRKEINCYKNQEKIFACISDGNVLYGKIML